MLVHACLVSEVSLVFLVVLFPILDKMNKDTIKKLMYILYKTKKKVPPKDLLRLNPHQFLFWLSFLYGNLKGLFSC